MRGGKQWTPQRVALVSLLMAWDDSANLAARFELACDVARSMKPHWKLGRAYSGFTQARLRESRVILDPLVAHLRSLMPAIAGRWNTIRGWQAFAIDGTRIEAPRTVANERTLRRAGRDKTAPQLSLTTLLHLGAGLPWNFRVGPGTESEKRHLNDMLDSLPTGSLLLGDAGFFSHELAKKLDESERFFLLRVGGNRTLLTPGSEKSKVVYYWPKSRKDRPPMKLRHIMLTRGKETIYLVTNVHDEKKLSKADASYLYALRWEQEVYHRSYKPSCAPFAQGAGTMNLHRVQSRTGVMSLLEVAWGMLSTWLLGLMSVRRQVVAGRNPMRWSAAKARDAVRRAMRQRPGSKRVKNGLDHQLAHATRDDYPRTKSKQARATFPRKKQEKPPDPPILQMLSAIQLARVKQLVKQKPSAA